MPTSEEVTERFQAESAHGRIYTVLKMQTFIHITTSSGSGRGKGSWRHRLDSGESVNQRSDTEFEIVWLDRADNEIITRI